MLPNYYVRLEKFPKNTNQKIDKKRLPNPLETQKKSNIYVAPKTKVEQQIAKIWEEVLQMEKISIYDDFFHLGGQSIMGIKIISRIHKVTGVLIELKDIFLEKNIAAIATHIETIQQLDAQEDIQETDTKLIF